MFLQVPSPVNVKHFFPHSYSVFFNCFLSKLFVYLQRKMFGSWLFLLLFFYIYVFLQVTVTEEPDTLFQSVSVLVKGHDRAVLDSYELFATMAAKELGITIGRVWVLAEPLRSLTVALIHFFTAYLSYCYFLYNSSEPSKDMERFTLLKSVHIFKKHRVQYEMRTHYRCIEVRSSSPF